jgi:hypothetical protein
MGASGAATLALDDLLVTDAFFPAHAYLPPHVHERASFATMLEGSFDIAIGRHAGAHVVVIQPDPAAIERLGPCGDWFGAVHHANKTPVCAAAWRIAREPRAFGRPSPL